MVCTGRGAYGSRAQISGWMYHVCMNIECVCSYVVCVTRLRGCGRVVSTFHKKARYVIVGSVNKRVL